MSVEAGDPLNRSFISPAELLALKLSRNSRWNSSEVQKLYKSQGMNVHDKHIELIVRDR